MNSMVDFFLFSLYHQYTLSSRVSPENSGRRGISRFSALHSHSVSHSYSFLLPPSSPCDLSPPTLQRPLAQYSCSLLPSVTPSRSEEHTSELQSRPHLVCRLLLEKKK